MPTRHYDGWPFRSPYDRETPLQYGFWANSFIRREHMELVENPANKNFNYQVIKEALEYIPADAGGVFLDIGCGAGIDMVDVADPLKLNYQGLIVGLEIPLERAVIPFADRFDKLAADLAVVGKDLSVIEDSRPRAKLREIQDVPGSVAVIKGTAQSIPFPNDSVRVAFAGNSLQHAPNALPEIWRVLEPGGILIVVTNAIGNKRRFHNGLSKIAWDRRARYSGPLSAKFSYEVGLKKFGSSDFTILYTRKLEDRYKITETDIPLVLDSADTYRSMFSRSGRPISADEWKLAAHLFLEEPVMEDIIRDRVVHRSEGASYDDARRGAIIVQKRP